MRFLAALLIGVLGAMVFRLIPAADTSPLVEQLLRGDAEQPVPAVPAPPGPKAEAAPPAPQPPADNRDDREVPSQGFQLAWMPFASETSATGFAEKLSRELDRNFIIVKVAPGRYEVRFRFSSEQDRDSVLGGIELLTGYRVPVAGS